ncbi:MAG TPA: hypothetical protein VH815_05850 [Acidobacteriota bacterium]|jgi:hypothetical protein
MKLKELLVVILISIAFAWPAATAENKYQVMDVKTSGWIKGKVSYFNKNLQLPVMDTAGLNPKICGNDPRKIEAVDLGANGELRNVVVYLKDINAGKEFKLGLKPPELTQTHCTFQPHVQVVPPFSSLRILNNDNTLHGVHAFQNALGTKFVLFPHSIAYPAHTLFNIAMVAERKESFQQLGDPGVVKFICEAGHNWMTAYVVVLPHPYFSKVDSDGNFIIQDVPIGKYTLVAWHEYFGTLESPIEVKANQPVVNDFLYKEAL